MNRRLLTQWLAGAALGLGSLGCPACDARPNSKDPPRAAAPAPESMLAAKQLDTALNALFAPLSPPVRLLSVVALQSQVIIQVQNSAEPTQVQEFRYRGNKVEGPTPVKLLGKGLLKDNLFNLETADPHVGGQVLDAVRAEYAAPVRKLVMVRNLPTSLDIQFRVYLRDRGGDLVIAADKQGKLLGPIPTPLPN